MEDIAPYAEFIAVAVVLFYIMAIVSALEAIINARTAQGAVAWTVSLLTLPYITVPMYLVFGRNRFDGYLEQREEMETSFAAMERETRNSLAAHVIAPESGMPLYRALAKLARSPATHGNHLDLLINGEQTFDSIVEGMQAAENYILFQFYIIRDDELGKRLGRVLADKARAGVRVYLIYDEIGSRTFPRTRLYKPLVMTGVEVVAFNTTQGRRNRFQLNFRNHRKVVVVDGKTAWIGGHNVGDEYLGLNKKIGDWRDTHTRLRGPAVLGAELTFATDWLWATRSSLDIDWDFNGVAQGECEVMIFPSDPASEFEEAGLMYLQLIVDARQRIWIASPYFVPDRGIISALQLAALRGVDVRLIIPDEPDGPMVGMANWAFTKELLPAGVKVYRYQGGFMHQKVLLMDDDIAGIGTANFDNRSFRLNFEVTLLARNPDFTRQVSDMLEKDITRSRLVTQAELAAKPRWFPLAMGVARLFSPVL
jgi:cardiolipin synthase